MVNKLRTAANKKIKKVTEEFLHNGLRIWHCHGYGIGHSCGLDLIPGLGASICHWCSHKRTEEGRKKERDKERKK